jgi:hypothetical protein
MVKKLRTRPYDATAYLKTEQDCALYLQAAIDESDGQVGEALDVLFDRFPEETAGLQIRLRFGQRGFEFALAQVGVLLAAHHHVFGFAAHRQRALRGAPRARARLR